MPAKTPPKTSIVLVSLSYAPTIGGVERQAQLLLERWAAAGQAVWVLTRRVPGSPSSELIHGVQVVRLWNIWAPGLSWVTFTWSVLAFLIPRRRSVGSIWSPMLNVAAFSAVLAGALLRRPVVMRISLSGPGGNIRVVERSLPGRPMVRFLLNACRYAIYLNQETKEELDDYGLPPGKAKRIANGVALEHFKPDFAGRTLGRQKLGIPQDSIATLFVGRLHRQKNLVQLLNVWSNLVAENPTARLLLIGEGPEVNFLKDHVRRLGVSETVLFFPWQSQILPFYQVCDVFILPSHSEGLSNALLEAMSCALSVLASRVPGNTQVVEAGKTGFLIDPDKPEEWRGPWQRLLRDADLRRNLGDAARKTIGRKYRIEAAFQRYQVLCRSVDSVGKGGQRAGE
jgi:glycosyltransferase involved in cell wall biosynthesis